MISTEKYEKVIDELSSVKTNWSLWEMYKPVDAKINDQDYANLMKRLIRFTNLKEFLEIWTHLPHGQPSKLFFNKDKNEIRKYKINKLKGEDFRQIDTICLFRGDIEPTWEDSHNSNGGIHHLMLTDIGPEEMDNLWLQLSTCIVLNEDLKFANKINGIRFCDKSKSSRNTNFRIEIWMECDRFQDDNLLLDDFEKIVKEDCGLPFNISYKAIKVEKKY